MRLVNTRGSRTLEEPFFLSVSNAFTSSTSFVFQIAGNYSNIQIHILLLEDCEHLAEKSYQGLRSCCNPRTKSERRYHASECMTKGEILTKAETSGTRQCQLL